MDLTIFPQKLSGKVDAIPSKSHAHRLFLCAALADAPTRIEISTLCDDLLSTLGCISGFGAEIHHEYRTAEAIIPIASSPKQAIVNCGESGSTLRFLLPIAGALGQETIFLLEGRLPYRPLSPLWEEMERHGCRLSWLNRSQLHSILDGNHQKLPRSVTAGLHLKGQLKAGHYRIDGGVSSQFISGLLMALPLLPGESHLELMGSLESKPYIDLTLDTLSRFGISWNDNRISGKQPFISPGTVAVEGDWSNAAFWLAANYLGNQIELHGLNENSLQGDREINRLLPLFLSDTPTISASDIPDLIPILAVVATKFHGAVFTDVRRLRMKESNRVDTIVSMIQSLGGKAVADDNSITISPSPLLGGMVDTVHDHRIAMAAAIASTICRDSVTLLDADCVSKSYPHFWKEFTRLGGSI